MNLSPRSNPHKPFELFTEALNPLTGLQTVYRTVRSPLPVLKTPSYKFSFFSDKHIISVRVIIVSFSSKRKGHVVYIYCSHPRVRSLVRTALKVLSVIMRLTIRHNFCCDTFNLDSLFICRLPFHDLFVSVYNIGPFQSKVPDFFETCRRSGSRILW